jgi:hypothetical protein
MSSRCRYAACRDRQNLICVDIVTTRPYYARVRRACGRKLKRDRTRRQLFVGTAAAAPLFPVAAPALGSGWVSSQSARAAGKWIYSGVLPPQYFIAAAMDFTVMHRCGDHRRKSNTALPWGTADAQTTDALQVERSRIAPGPLQWQRSR